MLQDGSPDIKLQDATSMPGQAGGTTDISSHDVNESSTLAGDGVLGGSGAISLDGWGNEGGRVHEGVDGDEEWTGFQPSKAERRRLARSSSRKKP